MMSDPIQFDERECLVIRKALEAALATTPVTDKERLTWYDRGAIVQRIQNHFDRRKNRKPKQESLI